MIEKLSLWVIGSGRVIARASDNNPIVATLTVWMFYVAFTLFESVIEALIWGDRFEHWFDPAFILLFMWYSACVVWWCAKLRGEDDHV